jgi:hypothetical protein
MSAAVRCTCPSCRGVYLVPDSLIGKEMKCPKCKNRVVARTIGGRTVLELAGVDGRATTTLHKPAPEPMTTEYTPPPEEMEVLDVKAAPKTRWWLWGAIAAGALMMVLCAGGIGIVGLWLARPAEEATPPAAAPPVPGMPGMKELEDLKKLQDMANPEDILKNTPKDAGKNPPANPPPGNPNSRPKAYGSLAFGGDFGKGGGA